MKTGDRVKVYPHGAPSKRAEGEVLIISANQCAIAVAFEDKPPFAIDRSGGTAIHAGRIIMMASRAMLNGKAWGPWVETFGNGHFEIEPSEGSSPGEPA